MKREKYDIDEARLERAMKKTLTAGSHRSWSEGACVMEAAALGALKNSRLERGVAE